MLRTLFVYTIVIATLISVGCAEEADNSRPVISGLPDQTLEVGDTVEMKVGISDADLNEITVNIISEDTRVASVSIQKTDDKSSGNSVTVSETRDPAWNVASTITGSDSGTEIETTFTIKAVAVGETTITVSATDDSGQDNAEAIPVTFKVTVKDVPLN